MSNCDPGFDSQNHASAHAFQCIFRIMEYRRDRQPRDLQKVYMIYYLLNGAYFYGTVPFVCTDDSGQRR